MGDDHRRFVEAATVDGREARAYAMLAERPELASAGLDCALVLGDAERVGAALRDDPGLVTRAVGAREWVPLMYASHTCFAEDRHDGFQVTVRLLLAAGADPNATAPSPDFPGSTWTPLYGAAGRIHDPGLTRMLLAAGADPDDGESLYHATETPDHSCLRLLLDAGAQVNDTGALPHMLDREDLAGARLLLEAGADATNLMPFAVSRGRSPEIIRVLAEHGADVTARGDDGRTPYAGAVLNGRDDLAQALAQLGAEPDAGPGESLSGAIARWDLDTARALMSEPPPLDARLRGAIVEFAVGHGPKGVVALEELGFGVELSGGNGGGPLHVAAWRGDLLTVDALLAHGAEVHARAATKLATPLGWAIVGSRHGPPGDHVAVARRLVAAGARVDRREAEAGSDELADYLRSGSASAARFAPGSDATIRS